MKKLLFSILFLPLLLVAQNECAPCNVLANSNMEIQKISNGLCHGKSKFL